jgi:hypothetical protein
VPPPKASPKTSKAPPASFAYDTQAIQGPDGQELSFEELRARDWEQTHSLIDEPLPQPPTQSEPDKPRSLLSRFADVAGPTGLGEGLGRGDSSEGLAADYQRLNLGGNSDKDGVARAEGLVGKEVSAQSGASSGKDGADDGFLEGLNAPTDSPVSRHGGLVDPTINTKEALADIMSMFNRPLPVETGRKGSSVKERTVERQSVRRDPGLPKRPLGGFSQGHLESPPSHDPTLQIFTDDAFQAQELPAAKEKGARPFAAPEHKIAPFESETSFDSDAENMPPEALASRSFPPRDIQSAEAQQSALRPLSTDRIQQLDVHFSTGQLASDYLEGEQTEPLLDETDPVSNPFELAGNPAEAALRAAGQEVEGDEFQVWSDDPSERASHSLAPQYESAIGFSSKPKIPRDEPFERSRLAVQQPLSETPVAGFSGRLESRGPDSPRGNHVQDQKETTGVDPAADGWCDAFIPARSLARSPGSVKASQRGGVSESPKTYPSRNQECLQ